MNRHGAYVRPWLENEILPREQDFSIRVHVKNREEAGGQVGNGWIAMRVVQRADLFPAVGAEWACMPVGGGTCPAAWPGRPTVTVVPLDKAQGTDNHGTVMSGSAARFKVTVNPAPPAGETRRVYLKTWEVFIEGKDPPCERFGHFNIRVGQPNSRWLDWDPYKHCVPKLRNKAEKVQHTAYSHVDVTSSGTDTITMPTEIFRDDPVNITGRNYWAEVEQDAAYSVTGTPRVEVKTTVFNPDQAPCWYGHTHYPTRMIRVDGMWVYSPAGMGITACLTQSELEQMSGTRVWTSCKVDYAHRDHPHTGTGSSHQHHNHSPRIQVGNGTCSTGQMQVGGQDSQDGQQDQELIPYGSDTFPAPGTLGFSDVTVSSMTVSWPQRTVDHYLVYWAEAVANAEAQFAQVDAGTLTYTITGLKADTEYAVIVYSQDYDEVTPTGYQRTAAAAPPAAAVPPAATDYTALIAQMYEWRNDPQWVAYQSHTDRWDRALLAFGQPVTDTTLTPMTAAEAQAFADQGMTRWEDVADALWEIEAADAVQDAEASEENDPPLPDPHASLIAQMYEWRNDPQWVAYQSHTDRWDRALLAFGEPVTDTTLTPMTAAEAQAFADRGMTRWGTVAPALRALEAQD